MSQYPLRYNVRPEFGFELPHHNYVIKLRHHQKTWEVLYSSSPFRHFVVVVAINGPLCILKANVVKASKRSSVDVSNLVVGDQK